MAWRRLYIQTMRKLQSRRPRAPICEIEEVVESGCTVAAEMLHRVIELALNMIEDWKSVPVPRTHHGIRKAARRCAVAIRE